MSDPPKTLKPSNIPPLKSPITTTSSSPVIREHRKGNWTIQETLILITAKKLDEERRVKPTQTTPDPTKPPCKPGSELRWKWVENYCWNHGCLRSQTQCNDKWDNLLREYKKVRDYESKSNSSNESFPSYWDLEKQHRKDRNLPSNMSFEVFQALDQVLQRRYSQTSTQPAEPVVSFARSPAPATEATVPPVVSESDSSETESSEMHDSSSKRRKVRRRSIGSTIMRSASVLAQTFRDCEEKKEKRHQEVMELEQRRLQIEEKQNEVNSQGMTSLVAAMTNLSGAIQSLISASHDNVNM
ncbi:trihelix transcription factor ASR3-like isoform X2 [Quercus lobata]|uniref:trihelix transcription factor ASR3-like isoform X2 n=1 Tax=Quercus lobata TaxID=97700 RepID=UPI001248B51D|nr:trihelix transcription factor ASR3-like isoform X2 [Quercus lobata]